MRTLVGIAGVAVFVASAPTVSADPTDGSFLSSLDQAGVTYKSGPAAVAAGKKACELMDQGHPKAQIIQSLAAENPGFSTDSATSFATSAANAYCPQHAAEPNTAPPTPLPYSQWPIIDFPIITPGAG